MRACLRAYVCFHLFSLTMEATRTRGSDGGGGGGGGPPYFLFPFPAIKLGKSREKIIPRDLPRRSPWSSSRSRRFLNFSSDYSFFLSSRSSTSSSTTLIATPRYRIYRINARAKQERIRSLILHSAKRRMSPDHRQVAPSRRRESAEPREIHVALAKSGAACTRWPLVVPRVSRVRLPLLSFLITTIFRIALWENTRRASSKIRNSDLSLV